MGLVPFQSYPYTLYIYIYIFFKFVATRQKWEYDNFMKGKRTTNSRTRYCSHPTLFQAPGPARGIFFPIRRCRPDGQTVVLHNFFSAANNSLKKLLRSLCNGHVVLVFPRDEVVQSEAVICLDDDITKQWTRGISAIAFACYTLDPIIITPTLHRFFHFTPS
jgi:hypothetical protein